MVSRLKNALNVVKQWNQFNLVFLNFYKDFEKFVKEDTEEVSLEETKYKPLQEQLECCLGLLDFEREEEGEEGIIQEFEEIWKRVEKEKKKERKSSGDRFEIGEISNIITCVDGVERTNEWTSPVTVSDRGSNKNSSFSFNWGNNSQIDIDLVKKDFVKLKEENKYLKKRIGSNSSISDLKCEICPSYLEIIDRLSNEKDSIESELGMQLSEVTDKYEEWEAELKHLHSKFENQKTELFEKVELEGDLRSTVSHLEEQNLNLSSTIKKITSSKDGYEALNNTVSDLSLALINKNK